jgi:serine/threonine-protein kinase
MRTEKVEEQEQLLGSWKEIAAYMGRTIRTCQRLESVMGLPIHRLDGSPKAHVFAYRNELDAWLAQKAGDREQGRRKPSRLMILGLAGAGALAAVAALALIVFRPGPAARSIAVVPFDTLGSEPGSQEYAAGLTEDLTTALTRIRGLKVAGRIITASVIKENGDAREAGRALKVRYLLEGSAQVVGERLRVTPRLIDTRDGFTRWTDTYDRPKGDFFEVRDGITGSVVDRIGIVLSAGEESAVRERPTADMQAFEYYLTGRYLLGRPWPETPNEALHFFDLALGRDPKFASAHVGRGWAYMNMISQFLARPNDVGPKAEKAAAEALALAPDLPEAIALDAWARFLYGFQWDEGEKGLARALELKPDDSMIRGWHAMALLTQRRIVEARAEIKRALGGSPFTPLMPVLSAYSMWIHLYTGRGDEVLEEFQRLRTVQPNFEFAHYGTGMVLLKQGRIDEAIETLKKACAFPHTNGRPDAGLAMAYVMKGDRPAAEAIYQRLLGEYQASGLISPVNLAWIQAVLGDMDAAYRWMSTAVQERDPSLPFIHIYVEGVVPGIASDPRFQAILDELRLPR